MARARRVERFLGFPRGGGAAVFPSGGDDLPDLAEADVWYSDQDPAAAAGGRPEDEKTTTTVGARAPRRAVGGLSRAFGDGRQPAVAASAPVSVPAWPSRFVAEEEAFVEPPPQLAAQDEGDGGRGWVPPHVYLAQRQARASVVEGVGRTLKGRDMSRVRDAVWSRTGFDG